MDEDTEIINQATRLEKINKFFIEYKIKIIILIILIFALIIGYFFILENLYLLKFFSFPS